MQPVDQKDLAKTIELDFNEGSYRSASQSISQRQSMKNYKMINFTRFSRGFQLTKWHVKKCKEGIDTNQQGTRAHSVQIVLYDDSPITMESISEKNFNKNLKL